MVTTNIFSTDPPGWLSGEHGGLMTWWLGVRSPVEANFLSAVFSPLTSEEACEKSSRWLRKEKLCLYWCEKARKHKCVTDRHDMTLAVKVALDPNTTNNFFPLSNPFESACWPQWILELVSVRIGLLASMDPGIGKSDCTEKSSSLQTVRSGPQLSDIDIHS